VDWLIDWISNWMIDWFVQMFWGEQDPAGDHGGEGSQDSDLRTQNSAANTGQ